MCAMDTACCGVRARLTHEIYTYCAFCVAVSSLPVLAVSYVVVRASKYFWLRLLSSRYPKLEFIKTDTVRSVLDTHRNQGIINVLLSVKGKYDAELIKQHLLEHVVNKRDKDGNLMFPRIRQHLVSSWGNYAWDANVPFAIENNFFVATAIYRGRTVGENNIQEYVSEIISKYFPSDQPPWQYIVIPCVSKEPKYYVLVRVHHLLLSGKKSLNVGDFLMMEQLKPSDRITTQSEYTQPSPLTNLIPTPTAIPELWGKINENLSNAWNEFVSEYDPMESTRALKTLPGVFHVAGLVFISTVNALKELGKKSNERSSTAEEASITAFNLVAAIQRECKKRNLTIPKIVISPLVTADPRKWPCLVFGAIFSFLRMVFKLPFNLFNELTALNELRTSGHARQPDTMTWKYADLTQLCVAALGELIKGALEIYRAPARLWDETIGTDDGKRHLLQTVSLCGRKVTSWSRSVPRASIERAARALGVSATDICLYAATEAVRALFEHAQSEPPQYVLATARAAPDDLLFTFAEGNSKSYKKSQDGGMVCVSLAVGGSPRRVSCAVRGSCSQQAALAGVARAQARYGAVTRALPSAFLRLLINVLSRRYALSYAEVNAPPREHPRRALWGDTVDAVFYWRPPQANISMSLTIIQYGDTVRLTVMADARLAPSHIVPAIRWTTVVEQLITKIDQEIAKITAQAHLAAGSVPQIITPQENDNDNDNVETNEENLAMLRPPAPTVASPPPLRRRITYN